MEHNSEALVQVIFLFYLGDFQAAFSINFAWQKTGAKMLGNFGGVLMLKLG